MLNSLHRLESQREKRRYNFLIFLWTSRTDHAIFVRSISFQGGRTMDMPSFSKIMTISIISIIAIGVMTYFSRSYRGHLQTGGKAMPAPETQVP